MNYRRIKKNADFHKMFSRGKRVFSPSVTILYYPSRTLSMGIAVSKKHGKAVQRNRIKRLVRAAFSDTSAVLEKPYSIIIIPRVCESYSYRCFKKHFTLCFEKVNSCAQ